jgi:putative ABC transport system ATP-binding protein
VLELVAVRKSFDLPDGSRLELLRRIDMRIQPGEILAISGRSGSGKSTLLNLLGLLDQPNGGRYQIDGRDVTNVGDRAASRLRGRHFGFVFQQFHLQERRTAFENVLAPLHHASWSEYLQGKHVAGELLNEVGLEDRKDHLALHLSGGEQQRVAIARSLIRNPSWLLADEPTGSLDVETGRLVLSMLLRLAADRGCGLVIVTHDPGIARLAGRRLVLDGGQLGPEA